MREHVTVVIVKVAHGVVVCAQSLVHEFLVVHASLVQAEVVGEQVGVVNGVAHPLHVAHVVFLSLFDLYPHIDVLWVYVPHAVAQDGGVAVSQLVVFLDKLLLVGFPALRGKLLRLEKCGQFARLVCLCECALSEQSALDSEIREFLVSLDDDVADAHFLLLVDDDVEYHLVLRGHVVALLYLDVGVFESLVLEVFLSQDFCSVDHVGRDLSAFEDAQLLLHVLPLALLQTDVVDLRYAWTRLQRDMQVHLVAHEGVGGNLHL